MKTQNNEAPEGSIKKLRVIAVEKAYILTEEKYFE